MSVVNAILLTGKSVAAAIGGGDSPGTDSLNKSLDAFKSLLLPHFAEEKEQRAKKAKEMLKQEVAGGELRFKVVGKDKKQKQRGR